MVGDQKRAVFIDRDGVIINLKNYSDGTEMDFLSKEEDIKIIEGSIEAIKLLNKNNFEVIIITNNPQVAKGLITEEEAIFINEEIKKIFFNKGAKIDGIYYCPHHPKGIIEKYSIECDCRKPLPGLLLKAARDHNINLNESYMIGDRISDIKAGNLAGCKKTIGVRTGYASNDRFKDAVPDLMADNLLDAVQLITKEKLKLFINTGGEGKRLYPLTKDIPKPLVKIKGKPILHHLIDWAKKYSIKEIILMNGNKAEKIIQYFGDGSDFGISIKHSNESSPLGSGGPLKYAQRHITGTSAYISGDLICDVNLNKMLDFHKKNNADITVLLHKSSHPHDSDILKIGENGQVIKFISKHDDHTDAGNLGNAGLCIIEPKIFDLMEESNFNFENYLYPKILEKKLKMMGYVTDELILDIGTPERLREIEDSDFCKRESADNIIKTGFNEHLYLIQKVYDEFSNDIKIISEKIISSYKNGNKVLIAGNGGSAADAQHIATELVNKLAKKSKALSAISLTTDSSVLTAWSNDDCFDNVFERQIEAHGNERDIFIAITTSGNSQNLINAVNKANEKGLITIGLLGRNGGKLKGLCNEEIIVPGNHVARIQESHEVIYHLICELVEEEFLK